MANRTPAERIQDALARLETEANVWIATASLEGKPHLVPLSLAWVNNAIVVATPSTTPTAKNARVSGQARATLDSADDVVIIDARAVVTDLTEADDDTMTHYINRVGWDPRNEQGDWSLIELVPDRVQAWNGVSEISGRTIMRKGAWLEG